MNAHIKWGVLGYARIAKNSVIPAIVQASNSELYAVASRDPEKLRACQQQFGCAKTYLGYEALLDDPEVQAVYIPLPNALHKEWTLKAAQRGKHILCEKPLALTSADCQEMIAACQTHQVTLMEAFMYRYTARIKQMQMLLQSGVLGDLKVVSSTFGICVTDPQSVKWQPELGGGSLYDVGCYAVNFVGLVTGAEPSAVAAEYVLQNNVDSLMAAVLRYDQGVIATVNSWLQAMRTLTSEIIGTTGRLIVPDTFSGQAGALTLITAAGEQQFLVPASERYVLEVEDFAGALLQHRPPLISLEETLRNMRVLDRLRALMPR